MTTKQKAEKLYKLENNQLSILDLIKEEFDLIWSEGAIDSIGFEKGLNYWNGFLILYCK